MSRQPGKPAGCRSDEDFREALSPGAKMIIRVTLGSRRSTRPMMRRSGGKTRPGRHSSLAGRAERLDGRRMVERCAGQLLEDAPQSGSDAQPLAARPETPVDPSDPDELIEYEVTVLPHKIRHTAKGRTAFNGLFRSLVKSYEGQSVRLDVVMTMPEEPPDGP